MNHYSIEPKNNTFKSLVVDITHRCNMHCANCYIPNRSIPDMDIDKLMNCLKQLPFKTFIRLIGAEPTMREDLPDIVRKIRKLGHHPSLTTNGLKLADYEYVKVLWENGLRLFLISMNGADDDGVYKEIDNGCYAEKKSQALSNLFKIGAFINVGCIIAKGINEHIPSRLVQLIIDTAKKHNYMFNNAWKSPCVRFKNIGAIGRYMKNRQYSFDDLISLISKDISVGKNIFLKNPCISGSNLTIPINSDLSKQWFFDRTDRSYMANINTSIGNLHIRLIDWTVSASGVPDEGNKNRGRITKDWKIAPFFEDKKLNEYGY